MTVPKTERNAEILRLWNVDGLSLAQIAKRLKISKNAVNGVVGRADDAQPRPSPIIRDRAPKPQPPRRVRPGETTLPPLSSEAR